MCRDRERVWVAGGGWVRTVGAGRQRQQRVRGERGAERRRRRHVGARPAHRARRAERPRPADIGQRMVTHQLLIPSRACNGPARRRLNFADARAELKRPSVKRDLINSRIIRLPSYLEVQ